MNKIDGGEPAFPLDGAAGCNYGMTLRTYFAAQAMQGLLASGRDEAESWSVATLAEGAVLYADALIAELNRKAGE